MTSKKYRGLPKKAKAKKPRLTDRVIELENRVSAIEKIIAGSNEAVPEPPAPAEEVKI